MAPKLPYIECSRSPENASADTFWTIMAMAVAILVGIAFSTSGFAADSIQGGALKLTRTFHNIGVEAPYTGDDNRNAVAELEFKKASDSAWRKALPLWRVDDGGATPGGRAFYGSALLLESGVSYEVRLQQVQRARRFLPKASVLCRSVHPCILSFDNILIWP